MFLRRLLVAVIALNVTGESGQVEDLLTRQAQLEEQIAALQQGLKDMSARQLSPAAPSVNAQIADVYGRIAEIDDKVNGDFPIALDNMWLLLCGALVMFMQAGFAILESGACREKNAAMVLMKNVLDACLGCLVWYLVGYGFAYGAAGEQPNSFIGLANFAGDAFDLEGTNHHRDWFFQWAFCATAATIVSGAVAERIEFTGYLIYSIVMTGLIYPVIVWWTWSGFGWLTHMGYSDFAGSGIVHLTGGIGALVGAAILGPRTGRFDDLARNGSDFDPHNMAMIVLGTFILWFGWYGFNCGSTLKFSTRDSAMNGALVAMNTTMAAGVGGLTVFTVSFIVNKVSRGNKPYDLAGACNGILAGLVAVCAGVGSIQPHGALVIGIVGGLAQAGGSALVKKLKVDDPLDAFAVHGCGGMVGLIMAPLLNSAGVQGEMLGAHLVGILAIIGWSGGLSAITFGSLRLAGLLRISADEELEGTDAKLAHHSPPKLHTEDNVRVSVNSADAANKVAIDSESAHAELAKKI